jgi:MFS family permease
LPNPFRTLRHRNFRLFWLGQTASLIGTWMQTMAQGWVALELSNSAVLVGLVAAAGSLPILLLSFHAGAVVDRVDKLRTVRLCQAAHAIQAGVLWWFTVTGRITITSLLILAALNGVIAALEIPARQSQIVDLVGRSDRPEAIALNSSGFNLARVIGPGIGAVIIARAGISGCFGINSLSYIPVLIGLMLIRLPRALPPQTAFAPTESIREGLRYMRDTKTVADLMKVVAVFSVLGVPYLTLMPVVARDRLHLGPSGYGVLLASVGVGGLLGALGLAAVGDRWSRGRLLSVASVAFATLLIAFALTTSPVLACIFLLGAGFSMIVNNALCNSLLQYLVPDHLRGRLMATYSFVVVGVSQVLGSFIAGTMANVVGVATAIAGGALVMLGYAYVAFYRRADLRAL